LLLIAGAVYFKDKAPKQELPVGVDLSQTLPLAEQINLGTFRPVDNTDKLFGETGAPIKLVVYTDLECPACKYFHQQIKLIEPRYITSGQVALVYREFPLDSIHSKVRTEFLASECVREIGGTDKYWQFVDRIFEITPSNNGLDLSQLAETAKELKIDSKSYEACVESEKYAEAIQQSLDEVIALGGRGTPFWLIVTKDQVTPVYGAVDAARLSAAFDLLLAAETEVEIEATSTEAATETEETTVTAGN